MKMESLITILHSIYCLPLSHFFLYIILATFCYLVIFFQFRLSKSFIGLCSIVYILVILVITLGTREPSGSQDFCLIPFASVYRYLHGQSEKLRESFMNLVLFYPLGLLLGSVAERKRIICIGFFLSFGIEMAQFIWKLGYAETDDVLHNTLGVAIGVFLMLWMRKKFKTKKK